MRGVRDEWVGVRGTLEKELDRDREPCRRATGKVDLGPCRRGDQQYEVLAQAAHRSALGELLAKGEQDFGGDAVLGRLDVSHGHIDAQAISRGLDCDAPQVHWQRSVVEDG